MTSYDIYIVNPAQQRLAEPIAGIEPQLFKQRGYILLGTDAESARQILRELKAFNGGGYVVPTEYREPRVTLEQARVKALDQVRVLVESGKRLGELDEGWDGVLWWSFRILDLDLEERDLTPDHRTICIDKLTGKLRTADDLKAWLELSGCE